MEWIIKNGTWYGYMGETLLYKVGKEEDGWYYECIKSADGMDGYDTAEEAKADAEQDCKHWYSDKEEADEWTDEDKEDAYWDAVAHERMERAMGLID